MSVCKISNAGLNNFWYSFLRSGSQWLSSEKTADFWRRSVAGNAGYVWRSYEGATWLSETFPLHLHLPLLLYRQHPPLLPPSASHLRGPTPAPELLAGTGGRCPPSRPPAAGLLTAFLPSTAWFLTKPTGSPWEWGHQKKNNSQLSWRWKGLAGNSEWQEVSMVED